MNEEYRQIQVDVTKTMDGFIPFLISLPAYVSDKDINAELYTFLGLVLIASEKVKDYKRRSILRSSLMKVGQLTRDTVLGIRAHRPCGGCDQCNPIAGALKALTQRSLAHALQTEDHLLVEKDFSDSFFKDMESCGYSVHVAPQLEELDGDFICPVAEA